MSRGGKLAWGLAFILIVILLWLFGRGQQRFAGGDVKLGDIFFGGYNPGSFVIQAAPANYTLNFEYFIPPSPGTLPGGPSDMPCDCSCSDIRVNFLDLTDWVAEQNAALYSGVTGTIQKYFARNPMAYTFANANRIDQFASDELYRDKRGAIL